MKKTLAPLACVLFTLMSVPAMASMEEFITTTTGHESGGRYDVINTSGSSAMGRYQIIFSNWRNAGYVEGTNWDNATFTDRARSFGVTSVNDLRYTSGGRAMQDSMVTELASDMWNGLSGSTTSTVGGTYSGVQINEAGLLGATWFLGPGNMNQWAASGYSAGGLRSLPNYEAILAQNPSFANAEELQAYLMNRIASHAGEDISDLTNGTYVPGGGTYTAETVMECEDTVVTAMNQEAADYIQNISSAANDNTFGFSQLDQPFGQLSCLDFAFTGGINVLFQAPTLSQVTQMAQNAVCSQVNSMVSNMQGQLTGKLQQLGGATNLGIGPFQNLGGVSASYDRNAATPFSFTTGNSNASFGGNTSFGGGYTSSGYTGSTHGSQLSGFDTLFQ